MLQPRMFSSTYIWWINNFESFSVFSWKYDLWITSVHTWFFINILYLNILDSPLIRRSTNYLIFQCFCLDITEIYFIDVHLVDFQCLHSDHNASDPAGGMFWQSFLKKQFPDNWWIFVFPLEFWLCRWRRLRIIFEKTVSR